MTLGITYDRLVLAIQRMANMGEERPPGEGEEQQNAIQPDVLLGWEWIEPDRRGRLDIGEQDEGGYPNAWLGHSGLWESMEAYETDVRTD